MLFASVVWFKLVSYAHTNYDMRALSKSSDKMEEHMSQVGVDTTNNKWNETLVLGLVDPNDSLSHPAGSLMFKLILLHALILIILPTSW
ncbi:diacylglycerol O-acyltransferase 1A-like isoform X2 [Papaver somniferum]|uniref:diacylglycerol O-acyltransferase 1A-like isoform X2 n=1 Tax=Papaver somniferum TaxID=3469 RepID=UPI000E6FDE08|nr:diacylglycerol O-acyltransferase 1A-like isoform X2 [Papaver somniferum]